MRLVYSLFAAALLCCSTVGAQAPATPKSALDKPTFEAYLRHLELLPASLKVVVGDPKPTIFEGFLEVPVEVVTPNGVATLRYFVSKDGRHIIKGNLFDISKYPFQQELNKLRTDLQPSFGTPGAPVVVVVFSDFQCPNCREEAKVVRESMAKAFPDKVRVYFKNFPLEQIHPWAKPAAMAARCVFRQQPTAFWDFHDWMFEHQPEINAENLKTKVIGWAESKNVDSAKLGQCMDTKATEAEVNREIAEARSLGVTGTPMMYINGRPLQGAIPWQTLEEIIKRELGFQQTSAATAAPGEKCCEVTIPSLVPQKK